MKLHMRPPWKQGKLRQNGIDSTSTDLPSNLKPYFFRPLLQGGAA